jgi:hypothetical protein
MRYIIPAMLALICTACSSGPTPQAAAPLPTPPQGPIITQIVSRDKVLIVRAGANGPTYSLQSKTGMVIVPAMTFGDLALNNPQLAQTVRTMQADAICASADAE